MSDGGSDGYSDGDDDGLDEYRRQLKLLGEKIDKSLKEGKGGMLGEPMREGCAMN
jgi:hypothetical protein